MYWGVNDIKYLKEGGYSDEDIQQIKASGKYLKLTYCRIGREKKINQATAIQILGRHRFISGMARSAFHFTTTRETIDGQGEVYFDCSSMFTERKEQKGMSKRLKTCIENFGWSVEQISDTEWQIERQSSLGEDVIECISGENNEEIVSSVKRLAYDFDVDEHVEPYISMRGTRGVPNSISELVKDAEGIKWMLDRLARTLSKWIDEEYETRR